MRKTINFHFLMSSERSGSNLLSSLIGRHPEITSPPIAHLFRLLSPLENIPITVLLEKAHQVYKHKLSPWKTDLSLNEMLINDELKRLEDVINYIFKKEADYFGVTSLFIKELKTYDYYSFLQKHFNDSKLIWLCRDPRDMALSWKKSPVHRGDVYRAANVWNFDQTKFSFLQKEHSSRILQTTYEKLTTNKISELEKIFAFLGFHNNIPDTEMNPKYRQQQGDSIIWKNINSDIFKNSNKFLNELSQKEIFFIEEINHDLMQQLGYERVTNKNEFDFEEVKQQIIKSSRHEKSEYKLLPENERLKRKAWHDMFIRITDKKDINNTSF